jgi:HD superfamily phosphohydrolase
MRPLTVEDELEGFLVIGGELKIDDSKLDAFMDFFHSVYYMYNSIYYIKSLLRASFMVPPISRKMISYPGVVGE